MIQEEKQLLLKDLCARVPYHPKGHVVNACNGAECDEWLTCTTFSMFTSVTNNSRLYLRPMSSMTEEEKKELKSATCPEGTGYFNEQYLICPMSHSNEHISYDFMSDILNWLNAHHFDYRGLIERGLAIEVTADNNPYKDLGNGLYELPGNVICNKK